jgi:hypothetical protein
MGKQFVDDAELRSEESPVETPTKRTTRVRAQKSKEQTEPDNFEDYARQSILKRKKAERLSFEREGFVMKKLQETNLKIRYHQQQMERINQTVEESLKQSRLEKEKEKIKKLIFTMRFFYREMTMIKENLKDFYQQVREEYIFG